MGFHKHGLLIKNESSHSSAEAGHGNRLFYDARPRQGYESFLKAGAKALLLGFALARNPLDWPPSFFVQSPPWENSVQSPPSPAT